MSNNETLIKELIDYLLMASRGLNNDSIVDYGTGCRESEKRIAELERQHDMVPITHNKEEARINWLWIRFRYVFNAELRRNAETFAMKRDTLIFEMGFLK